MIFTIALVGLLGWIYLALFHASFWQPYFLDATPDPDVWPSVDIVVPARDEADVLPKSLSSLFAQSYPGSWRVILVDDHSTDGTGALAQKIAAARSAEQRLTVLNAPDLLVGWRGKVAAMQTGYLHSKGDYVLFTDADIEHPADSLKVLAARALDQRTDLTSLMVRLRCTDVAERLLIPAFVFFFTMLYPFRRVRDVDSKLAAAAGGAMLVRRAALDRIGGMRVVRDALIDDCALAKAIKSSGGDNGPGRIELALTRDVRSLRAYPELRDMWQMIARTAFNQLRYSPMALIGTVLGMTTMFIVPIILPVTAGFLAALLAMGSWALMTLLYLPIVRYYRLSWYWALTLPIAGAIYTGATIDSARLYWQGKGGQWKGRVQA